MNQIDNDLCKFCQRGEWETEVMFVMSDVGLFLICKPCVDEYGNIFYGKQNYFDRLFYGTVR